MKVVIIVQARMTSTRLPGKILMDVAGRPMLALQVERLAKTVANEIVLATTVNADDDPVVDLARKLGIGSFRGSEPDVLSRFVGAAWQAKADVVVRVTGDCPLIDPGVVDRVVNELTRNAAECDYASNVLTRTYPRGLDTEAFFWDTLLRMDRLGRSTDAREHVTLGPRSHCPHLFLTRSVEDSTNNGDLRWTVDTPQDLEMVRALAAGVGLEKQFVGYTEILAYARARPDLASINREMKTWEPNS